MEEVATKRTLAAKLATIMGEVGGIPKDKKNEQQGYMYRSEDAVLERLRGLLAKENIAVMPRETQWEALGTTITGKQLLVRVKLAVDFIDGDTGEVYTSEMSGVGADSGDKATFKGTTGAFKYVMFKTFCISSGDDPESNGDKGDKPATTTASPKAAVAMPKGKAQSAPPEPPPDNLPPDPYPSELSEPVAAPARDDAGTPPQRTVIEITKAGPAGKERFTVTLDGGTRLYTTELALAQAAKAAMIKGYPVWVMVDGNTVTEIVPVPTGDLQ